MSKYTPLGKYLQYLKRYETLVNLSFEEIENIIGEPLPPSAHNSQSWWANDSTGSHTHASAWLEAGWRVERIDFFQKSVLFSLTE